MDAAAVSLAAAASGYAENKRAVFRLAFHFGLFQFLMPILGWLSGYGLAPLLKSVDHWVAFVLLVFVGGKMVLAGINPKDETVQNDPSKGLAMVLLSIATSIDAYAVGLGLVLLNVNVWYPAVIIGIITGAFSFVAIRMGRKLSQLFGQRLEIVGGLILIIIGLKILIAHIS